MKLLIRYDAEESEELPDGRTASDVAIEQGYDAVVRKIQERTSSKVLAEPHWISRVYQQDRPMTAFSAVGETHVGYVLDSQSNLACYATSSLRGRYKTISRIHAETRRCRTFD